ncbi:hypothetical protein NLJ89_g12332 [Agrocybe chaxingu]|uniref:Uncharacterized protein n=1 Tax=Agrocybe chaxingu TaxID=84603 RepID=A0A9W8JMH9_9AGAR|nr:hypothetical protein NLJ89_g12332 [Agrocybe chaxingu]
MRGKESSWLQKTRSGAAQHSRWVWVVGLFLILCIAGGIGFGVYASRNSPDHQKPTAIGGSADNAATFATAATAAAVGTAAKSSTRLHVSPTNTVERREAGPEPTGYTTPRLMYRHEVNISRSHSKRRLGVNAR